MTSSIIRLAILSEEFSKRFAREGVPPLPKLLAMISTATHKTTANHFYATVLQLKDLIPLYLDVVLWMLKRDLLIRLHLRIRVIATEELKKRVRQSWEQHIARKRSRSRTRRDGHRRGSVGGRDGGNAGEKVSPDFEVASDSSPVEYWVSLSPKSARKRARHRAEGYDEREAEGRDKDEDGADDGDEDEGHRDREKHDAEDGDEEVLSSSTDEAKWAEYYKDGTENDNIPSMIGDPARATPLERRWLAGMSEGKDPHIVRRLERYACKFSAQRKARH